MTALQDDATAHSTAHQRTCYDITELGQQGTIEVIKIQL